MQVELKSCNTLYLYYEDLCDYSADSVNKSQSHPHKYLDSHLLLQASSKDSCAIIPNNRKCTHR